MIKKLLIFLLVIGCGWGIYWLFDHQGALDLVDKTMHIFSKNENTLEDSGIPEPLLVLPAEEDSGSSLVLSGETSVSGESLGDLSEIQSSGNVDIEPVVLGEKKVQTPTLKKTTTTPRAKSTTTSTTNVLNSLFK